MVVWHCCSAKKFDKYRKSGKILAPVRAWEDIEQAKRMSLSRGTLIILRLKFPNNAPKCPGHFGKARIIYYDLPFRNF